MEAPNFIPKETFEKMGYRRTELTWGEFEGPNRLYVDSFNHWLIVEEIPEGVKIHARI